MNGEVLQLLDPKKRIRSVSESIRRSVVREYGSMASLMAELQPTSRPLLAVADAVEESVDGWSTNSFSLLLVVVRDEEEGYRWLHAGATDFVVSGRPAELEARFKRILRLHRDLLSPDFQEQLQGEFLRDLAHAMKNPLNCILGFTELMLQDPTIPRHADDDLRSVLTNAEALLDIVEKLGKTVSEPDTTGSRRVEVER
ncbi:MAG: hypothetical protein O7J95_14255 [Planctomycetota bacterium]|nr:hypothetical protein [Planctomycetota bacterium]